MTTPRSSDGLVQPQVLSWRVSNCLDSQFCVEALADALTQYGRPEIFNADQGSQFTATAFAQVLREHHVLISMDGRKSYFDHIFIERLWRSVKYQYVYLNLPENGSELRKGLRQFFAEYNARWHQSLRRRSPNESYQQFGCTPVQNNSWIYFVSMLLMQMASATSLRDIRNGLRSATGNLNHLGV